MTAQQTRTTKAGRKLSPLLVPAALLSLASLAWTTWSLVDLLGTGWIALTVAGGSDFIWGSVIIAEARGIRITIGKKQRNIVPAFGWTTLLIVAVFLAWHGIANHSPAMAAAGPFLPFGAKAIWVLALADMRNPSALTHDEIHQLARMERGMVFEEQQHDILMRQQRMRAELLMSEVSVDFDIELMRQNRTRDLNRRRPLELTAGDTARITHHNNDAHQMTEAHHEPDASTVLGVSATPHRTARTIASRTDAVSEAAAHTHDAHQMPATAIRPDAPRITDAALHLDGLSKAAAVRVVRDALPTASAPQISQRLAHHGIEASDAYVRTVLSREKQQRPASDGGYL